MEHEGLLLKDKDKHVDWLMLGSALLLSVLGLLTMSSFQSSNPYFERQIIWLGLSLGVFFTARTIDWHAIRRSGVAVSIYGFATGLLVLLFILGRALKGAHSWFTVGGVAFEPAELAVLALVVVLAKYFTDRHVEIAHVRHIIVSGIYAFILFILVALQPDLGGSIIIFLVWLGMVLVSGISRKHLLAVFLLGVIASVGLWNFGLHEYQRQRILSFIHPLADIRGSGYNAYQAMIALGSGQVLGKGIGYGTQSKLKFLPEYQTDFMFAAFAEEWGFIGIVIVFALFGVLFWRILFAAARGATNFETLFALGVLFYILAHVMVHAGISLGLMPVTGTTIPFMSYGGSHLLVEFLMLGMISGMSRYSNAAHREQLKQEFSGGYDV